MKVKLQHQRRGECPTIATADVGAVGVPRKGDNVSVDGVGYVVLAVFWDVVDGALVPTHVRLK